LSHVGQLHVARLRQSVSVVRAALGPARSMLLLIAIFSGVVNILALTSSIYMLQVYDRVLSSRSIPTLIALSLAALWLYGVQAILDVIRARMLVRISENVERDLAPRVFRVIVEMPLRARVGSAEAMQPLRIALQSAVLALGAYFVIHGNATGGIMLAASVTMSRALCANVDIRRRVEPSSPLNGRMLA